MPNYSSLFWACFQKDRVTLFGFQSPIPKSMKIISKSFEDLTSKELYALLKLRYDVFVVEQDCIYDEFDNLDQRSKHIWVSNQESIVAYIRWYKKTESVAVCGRLVTDPSYRNGGLGSRLDSLRCKKYKSINKLRW